jgi:hypothetical protein
MSELTHLQRHYRTALYSYFRVNNLPEAYKEFIKNPHKAPVFTYSKSVNVKSASLRLKHLKEDYQRHAEYSDDIKKFLDRRITETKALLLFARHKDEAKIDDHILTKYRRLQHELYGDVIPELFFGIKRRLNELGKSSVRQPLPALYSPSKKTFDRYKQIFNSAFPELQTVIDSVPKGSSFNSESIKKYIELGLRAIGADKAGWQVENSVPGTHIVVSKHSKKVLVGRHTSCGSAFRLKQILAHEIGTHVQKTLAADEYIKLNKHEEGLAIVAEQLMSKNFFHKRTMRYYGLCLAMGVDNIPRSFSDTYKEVRSAMQELGYMEEEASKRAFYEVARIFRGGFPEVPGAVFLKDKVYLESNINIWKALEKQLLEPDQFKYLFMNSVLIEDNISL